MGINERGDVVNLLRGTSGVGVVAVALLVGLTAFAALFAGRATGASKVVGIAWVAFAAMAGAAPLGARSAGDERALTLVWGYGLASGAMVTSAAGKQRRERRQPDEERHRDGPDTGGPAEEVNNSSSFVNTHLV